MTGAIEHGVGKTIGQHPFTDIDGGVFFENRVHRKVEGYRAVTIQSGLEGEVIIALLFIVIVIVFIYRAFADGLVDIGVFGRIDRQREFIYAVTVVSGGAQAVPEGVCSGGQHADLFVVTFPNVSLVITSGGGLFLIEDRGDGQNQLVNTVAAVHGFQAVPNDMVADGQQVNLLVVAFPYVGCVFTGGCIHFLIESAMNGQGEFINAVTAVHGLQAVPNNVFASF